MRHNLSPIVSYQALLHDLPDSWVADILELGYDINQPDADSHCMLGVTCEHLQLENVKLALSVGANPSNRDETGRTPLLAAIDVSQQSPLVAREIVEALLDAGADIEGRGYMDKTPFLKACTRGSLDILKLLVLRGCDIHARANDVGNPGGIDCAYTFDTSSEFKTYLCSLYGA